MVGRAASLVSLMIDQHPVDTSVDRLVVGLSVFLSVVNRSVVVFVSLVCSSSGSYDVQLIGELVGQPVCWPIDWLSYELFH